jgi:rhodanese-related sulfurtransferase|tara:strand:- start:1228 stop:2826 length:1599 start_codon:yes stop_codon:yes gene_type:complete
MTEVSVQELKPLLTDGAEIAFLDIREHGQYGEGHPFFSVNLPFSKIEALAEKLMPNLSVRCVLMDDDDQISIRAKTVLEDLGYNSVSILTGGAPAWAKAGHSLFKGVNVPSKAFGELVEHAFTTKSVSAEELWEMQKNEKDLLVLDGRSESEFKKMSIPQARSCPNAELGYRLQTINDDPSTTIVVNCAGRTRSIIGAQTLALLDTPNSVYALRNGTQGWSLAGFELNHGANVVALPQPNAKELEAGRVKAAEMRDKYGLQTLSNENAQSWLIDPTATTYLFDVRSREEYEQGHVPNARSAPGGQLVQATDEQLAVRNARIVLSCDNGLRSATTAIWLSGMGHQVWLLDSNTAKTQTKNIIPAPFNSSQTIEPQDLKRLIDAGAQVLDASRGLDFRAGHIKNAKWITRARIDFDTIEDIESWVLTGRCSTLMAGILKDIEAATGKSPQGIVVGTPEIWRSVGLAVVETPNEPTTQECIDYLFFVHDRHDGNLNAARRYLEWELGLLEQLDDQERSVLKPIEVLREGNLQHAP